MSARLVYAAKFCSKNWGKLGESGSKALIRAHRWILTLLLLLLKSTLRQGRVGPEFYRRREKEDLSRAEVAVTL